MADISKVVVPALDGSPGGLYNIKDAVAREMLSGGINFSIAWDGQSTPVVSYIPDAVSVRYNDTVYTGTLTVANAQPMTFYLVKEEQGEGSDRYVEYVVATDPDTQTKYWERIGFAGESLDNFGALAYMDSVDLEKGLGVNVIGENATLTAQSSAVTFGSHTTAQVLGSNATFTYTDPVYSLTPSKGTINLTRSNDVALDTRTGTFVTALDGRMSTTATFLKSNTTFTRKKVNTATIYGVNGTTSKNVDLSNSTKRKLLTDTMTPAASLTITGSDLVTANTQSLVTTTVLGIDSSTSATASNITATPTGTLDTDTFKKVSQISTDNPSNNEWKDTIANLDIHMYNAVTDGTSGSLANADSETLIITFKTLPSLKLATSDTIFAKGNVTGGTGAASFVTAVTKSDVTVPVVNSSATTVATGSISASGTGSSVVTSLNNNLTVNAAQVGTAVRFATGEIASTNTANNNEQYGGEVYTALSGSVDVPAVDSNSTTVLTSSLTTATNNSGDVNFVTEVTPQTANAYTAINFETDSALNNVQVSTQPVFTASVTSDANGSVLTGVTISKDSSGSIAVASNYTPVDAITALGTATAAAQTVAFDNKDLKKVPLYNDLNIATESHPATRYLNLMPPGGGTITFKKEGTPPTLDLECSLDGVNWETWTQNSSGNYVKTVSSGQRLYIRNANEHEQYFHDGGDNYYRFVVPDNTEVNGIIESLLSRVPEMGDMKYLVSAQRYYAFKMLFYNQKITGNIKIMSNTIYYSAFSYAFQQCKLSSIELHATTINNTGLYYWLNNATTGGSIKCYNTLTIATNDVSGIPTGWTRVDL